MPVTDPTFNPSGSNDIAAIKEMGLKMEQAIHDNCPGGRRKSLALTNLETALMYAVKSAAVGD